MSTPAELVSAALASVGTPVDADTAERIVVRMTPVTVRDANAFDQLAIMARRTLDVMNNEPREPLPLSREERARQWLSDHNFDVGTTRGEKKLTLFNLALAEVDKADTSANSTNEARALARLNSKSAPTAFDALDVANARLADAGNKRGVGIAPIPLSALPPVDPTAPLNPIARLHYANRLSGPALASWREWSRASARAATLPAGMDRMQAEEHAGNLARALQVHGISVQ